MSGTIKLNVINQTTDKEPAHLVICQHNAAAGLRANPIAWQVLRNIAAKESRLFELPDGFEIEGHGPEGQVAPKVPCLRAQAYVLGAGAAGLALAHDGARSNPEAGAEVRNTLTQYAEVQVFKAGRLLAVRAGLPPGEIAAFHFHPHLYIGHCHRLEEGGTLSNAVASRITTRINLFGVSSADIVMTSSGSDGQQPEFRLENLQ